MVCLSGVAGGVTAGATANSLINDQLTDSNYEIALNFILQELVKARKESLSATEVAEITHSSDQDNFFSKEKELLRLAARNILETFGDCSISKTTRKSKENVIEGIKVIKSINRIRETFSQQCFIGIVGVQDAGKTTLIEKIWNVGNKFGYFVHTKQPEWYQITQKVLVFDFPGSNSFNNYSKSFSICGAINNMVIVAIPFSGGASKTCSE